MARRDSTSNPLDSSTSGSRTTTLDPAGTTGTTGSLGTSGLSGTPGVSGTSGVSGASTGASGQTNWQRAGQETTQGGSQGPAAQVKDEAKGLASEAKNEVMGIAGQARDHVQNLVGERKDRAAEQIGSFASSLRDAAQKLQDGDGGATTALGRYATTAADQVDRLSQYLRDRDLNAFVRDAETFARRHPDVFLGGTFIAGLVLARFFKASERRQQDDLSQDWQRAGYGGAYGSTYGTSYGNTYNTGYETGTSGRSSLYEEDRSESSFSPGGPVPPVGG